MKIAGVPRLELEDDSFVYKGARHAYADVVSVFYTATATRNSFYFIPTGTSYESQLLVFLQERERPLQIKSSSLARKRDMEALHEAKEHLCIATFEERLAPLEESVERRDFFSLGDLQFHESGDVFQHGRLILNLHAASTKVDLSPFNIRMKSGRKRALDLGLRHDRDCILYMFKHHLGISWAGQHVRSKRVNRRRLLNETVLRFGALLAMADGRAEASEMAELKRFFRLSPEETPEAPRIFNEQIRNPKGVREILEPFAEEFEDEQELKESFLLGMLSVALADGHLHPRESALIREAAQILGLGDAGLARVFAAAGVRNPFSGAGGEHRDRARDEWSRAREEEDGGYEDEETRCLRLLGLERGAGREEIISARRRLAMRYHPDRLRAKQAPEEEIQRAGRILAEINAAYETLLKMRSD